MAQIWLSHGQLGSGLPQICLRCGVPATQIRMEVWCWSPLKVWEKTIFPILMALTLFLELLQILPLYFGWEFFFVSSFLLFEVVKLLTTRRVRLPVPYCEADTVSWSWGNLIYYTGLTVLFVLAVLAGWANTQGFSRPPFWVMVGGFGGLVVLVGIGLVLREHDLRRPIIRALQITSEAILLEGVAPGFAEAAQNGNQGFP